MKKEIESLQDDKGNIPDDEKAELEAKIKELEDEKLKLETKIDKAEKDLEAAKEELKELQETINELNASVYGVKYYFVLNGKNIKIEKEYLGELPEFWSGTDFGLKNEIENYIYYDIGNDCFVRNNLHTQLEADVTDFPSVYLKTK